MLPTAADVAGSVCLLDTTISCAKMAKPIKMPFGGGVDFVGPKKRYDTVRDAILTCARKPT